mmetsp:Transcript_14511/g.33976  ORF Transcript_14511/g.33976 Transcript_14511/m.33976 type:complete len:206 (+) Transcript_14511:170-787(+)
MHPPLVAWALAPSVAAASVCHWLDSGAASSTLVPEPGATNTAGAAAAAATAAPGLAARGKPFAMLPVAPIHTAPTAPACTALPFAAPAVVPAMVVVGTCPTLAPAAAAAAATPSPARPRNPCGARSIVRTAAAVTCPSTSFYRAASILPFCSHRSTAAAAAATAPSPPCGGTPGPHHLRTASFASLHRRHRLRLAVVTLPRCVLG